MRAIVWSATVSAPRQIDVHHLGNPLVICCFQLDDVIVDPGPESSHRTLLEALDEPAAADPADPHPLRPRGRHRRARAPLARRRGLGPRARRAAPRRPQPADRERRAPLRRRHGAPVGRGRRRARGQPARPERRRDDRRRGASSTRPATRRTTSPTCTSPPARPSSATSAACASRAARSSRRRRRPTSTSSCGTRRSTTVAAWEPARLAVTHFGTLRRRRRAPRRDARGARPLGGAGARDRRSESYAAAMVAEMERAPDATATQAFLQAMPPDTLWPGLDRYWTKKNR